MWLIIHMRSMLKMKLSCHNRLDWVRYVMKTKEDNYVTDLIGLVHAKTETELLVPI